MLLQLLRLKLPCHSSEGCCQLAKSRKSKEFFNTDTNQNFKQDKMKCRIGHTDPCVVWAGTTIRTPGGSDVTVRGDFPGWLGRTVTTDAPVADC